MVATRWTAGNESEKKKNYGRRKIRKENYVVHKWKRQGTISEVCCAGNSKERKKMESKEAERVKSREAEKMKKKSKKQKKENARKIYRGAILWN